jgi:hypothetical protein
VASNDRQINVGIVGKDAVSRPMRKIRVEAGLLGKSFKAVGSTASTFASDFKKIGAGVGLATAGVIAFGASAVKAAAEDEASSASLIAVLKARKLATDANLKTVDAMIAAGQDLAFSDDETRASIATATQFTNKMADAQKINAAAMELSRAKHISLEAATTLVGKAYAGNLVAAKKLGIEIPKGTKGIAAAILIQKKFAGSSKAYAETFAGSFAVVQDKVSELKESIGKALLPAVTKVFNGLKPILGKLIADITKNLPKIQEFADSIATKILDKLPGILSSIETTVPKIKDYIQGLIDKFVGMGKSANDILGPGGDIRVALTGLGAALGGIRGAIAANFIASGVDPIQAYFFGTVADGVVKGMTSALTGEAVAILIKKFALTIGTETAAAAAAASVAGGGGGGGIIGAIKTALGIGAPAALGAAGAAAVGGEAAVAGGAVVAGEAAVAGGAVAGGGLLATLGAIALPVTAAVGGVALLVTKTQELMSMSDATATLIDTLAAKAKIEHPFASGYRDPMSDKYSTQPAPPPDTVFDKLFPYLKNLPPVHAFEGGYVDPMTAKYNSTSVQTTTTINLDGRLLAKVVDDYLGGSARYAGAGRLVPGAR